MATSLYNDILLHLHLAYPFLSEKTVPLSIGCGNKIRKHLEKTFTALEVHEFINTYFSRHIYVVSMINTIDGDLRRFNLDGTPSNDYVEQSDLIALAFNPTVYLSADLNVKAKAFCAQQKSIRNKARSKLKNITQQMEVLGFTHSLIVSKLGKASIPYFTDFNALSTQPKTSIHQATLMSKKTCKLNKKKLKVFQSKLLTNGTPVSIIIKASNNYEDYLYYRLFEAPDKQAARKLQGL